MIGYPSS